MRIKERRSPDRRLFRTAAWKAPLLEDESDSGPTHAASADPHPNLLPHGEGTAEEGGGERGQLVRRRQRTSGRALEVGALRLRIKERRSPDRRLFRTAAWKAPLLEDESDSGPTHQAVGEQSRSFSKAMRTSSCRPPSR